MLNRRKKRELVFLLLFENVFNGYSLDEIKEIKFLNECLSPADLNGFVEEYFSEIIEKIPYIDKLIGDASLRWGKDRLSKVALTILRLAIYEMIFRDEVPTNVAINEAVELSKKYGTEKESSFINGVLGGISRSLEKNNG